MSADLASASLGQRSVKFTFQEDVKDYDIVRALLVSFDKEDIERVQSMPGHIWLVIFKNVTLAEEATYGFILKEEKVRPKLVSQHFITTTVAYVPPDVPMREIEEALERFADVLSLKELYMRDFPGIKNGKQRAVLKPREGGLPSFFPIRDKKASLFFTGRISCCPYCEERDHLGRDCPTKRIRRCFTCRATGHIRRNCPGYDRQNTDNYNKDRTTTNNNKDNTLPERMDAMPSVSADMAGIAVLSDGESTSSGDSLETVVEAPQNKTDSNTTNPPTETRIEKTDNTDKTEQDAATAEVLTNLFADNSDSEDLTAAEKFQLQQEQEEQQTQELFPPTDPGTNTTKKPEDPEKMEINQNNKRKPLSPVDLRQKFGQSPKPRRSPKHKRKKKDKL